MPKGRFVVLSHNLKVDFRNRFLWFAFHMKGNRTISCRTLYCFIMDLLERLKQFIEEENYPLEAIHNAELANLGKCAIISSKGLLAGDLSASRQAEKSGA